ncbi:carbohydrate ABC transporter membrane protein 1 (CUT1 family) [Micromonospora sp. Llam0]|uniref:carbohydrate ABC transporter permease n=1 Tax=Micromonospora sp. Llam0 TaxID=2485143 RepID=UPI000F4A920E|nr:sugar ABC transporter permease [Micromonospora sp. Llam0]ROO59832.1 carbohydrate ABC transporter membrane protein 1 (CUT1 family) [Micromonospora sp. Llam0]
MTSSTVDSARPAAAGRRRPATPPSGRRNGDPMAGYLFLSPWIVGMLLLTVGPMAASLYLSFTDYNLFTTPEWVGLDNYRRLVDDDRWLQSVRVTAGYVLLAVPLKLAAALAVAMLLNQRRRGQGFYRAAFYGPSLIGASVSVAIVWKALFSDDAVVDRLLSWVGLDSGGWVGNPDFSLLMLVLLAAWQFGAPMVIFLAGLKQVPAELYEAAEVDGAGRGRRFWSVTLPMISPVLFFNLLLETINSFQIFTSAYVIGGRNGSPAGSTLFYTVYLYDRGFTDFRMGYASAMAWMLLLGVGLVTAMLFRTARGWVHYSGDNR